MTITSYAQNFEDVLLWRAVGQVERGFYIDIGAQHPSLDSVSLAFYERGWRGLHVEPTNHYADMLRVARPGETVIQAAIAEQAGVLRFYEIPDTGLSTASRAVADGHLLQGFKYHETTVTSITLDALLATVDAPEIHWLKIDVEGYEHEVLAGWRDAPQRPWVVVVESTLPMSRTPSHQSWEPLLLAKGYRLAHEDGINRFYASDRHPELVEVLKPGPNVFDAFQLASSSWAAQGIKAYFNTQVGAARAEAQRKEADLAQLRQQQAATEAAAADRAEAALLGARQEAEAARRAADDAVAQAFQRERLLADRLELAQAEFRQRGATEERLRQAGTEAVAQAHQREVMLAQRLEAAQAEYLQREAEAQRAHAAAQQSLQAHADGLRQQAEVQQQHADALRRQIEAQQQHAEAIRQQTEAQQHHAAALQQHADSLRDMLARAAQEANDRERALRQEMEGERATLRQEALARESALRDQLAQAGAMLQQREAGFNERMSELLNASASREGALRNEAFARDQERRKTAAALLSTQKFLQDARASEAVLQALIAQQKSTLAAARAEADALWRLPAWRWIAPVRRLRAALAGEPPADSLSAPAAAPTAAPAAAASVTPAAAAPVPVPAAALSAAAAVPVLPSSPLAPAPASPDNRRNHPMPVVVTHISQLFDLQGEAFIQQLYRTLLRRVPDPEGLEHYLGHLRMGHGKGDVIAQVARSKEGRNIGIQVPGLAELVDQERRRHHWLWGRLGQGERIERHCVRLDWQLGRLEARLTEHQAQVVTRLANLEHKLQANLAHRPAAGAEAVPAAGTEAQPAAIALAPLAPEPVTKKAYERVPTHKAEVYKLLRSAVSGRAVGTGSIT